MLIRKGSIKRLINNFFIRLFITKPMKKVFLNQNKMYYDYYIYMANYNYNKKVKKKKDNKKIVKQIKEKLKEEPIEKIAKLKYWEEE